MVISMMIMMMMMIMIILMCCWLWHFNSILHLLCHVIFIYLTLLFSHFGYYFNERLLICVLLSLADTSYITCGHLPVFMSVQIKLLSERNIRLWTTCSWLLHSTASMGSQSLSRETSSHFTFGISFFAVSLRLKTTYTHRPRGVNYRGYFHVIR